jgi:hypothetical protein
MNYQNERLKVLESNFPEGTENFDSGDFLYCFGNATEAILYSTLFLPDIEEFCGRVVLSVPISDPEGRKRFVSAVESEDADREEMVASFNWIEVGYVFSKRRSTDEEDEVLATLIAESWRNLLKGRYPERQFIVRVIPPEETGSTVGVGFVEKW